jgi:hypothetical protein
MIYNDFSYSNHINDDRELKKQAQSVQNETKQEKKTKKKITKKKFEE